MDGFEHAGNALREVPKKVGRGTKKIAEQARHVLEQVRAAFDYKRAIDKLEVDDQYTLSLNLQGWLPGNLSPYGMGKLEVTREADGYVLKAEGEVGAGLFLELGISQDLGMKSFAGAELAGFLGGGAAVELTFKNAAQAKRAMDELLTLGIRSKLVRDSTPDNSHEDALRQLRPGFDAGSLRRHVSAVSLSGSAFGYFDLNGYGGPTSSEALAISTHYGEGGAKASARFELDEGKLSKVSTSGSLYFSCNVTGTRPQGSGAASLLQSSLRRQFHDAEVTFTQTFDAPKRLDFKALPKRPAELLSAIVGGWAKSQDPDVLTLTASSEGAAGAFTTEIELTGEQAGKLFKRDLLSHVAEGDLEPVLQAAGELGMSVDGAVREYRNEGFHQSIRARPLLIGCLVDFRACRRDYSDDPMWSWTSKAEAPEVKTYPKGYEPPPAPAQANTGSAEQALESYRKLGKGSGGT